MDREPSNREYDGPSTATAKALAPSPVDDALAMNNELIQAIEKQVEVLFQRLEPVSSRTDEPNNGKDSAAPRGSSTLVETIAGHGYRLSSVSDRLSKLTRNLEV